MATASPPHAELRTITHPTLASQAITLWHLTSLDAPTVAVTWLLAFAHAAQTHLPLWLPVTLALSAWTFYIADRLMDAKTAHISAVPCALVPAGVPGERSLLAGVASPSQLRPRHHFHWRHRRIFLPIAIVSAIVALALVLHYMPLPARERNSVLAAATLIYFTTVHTPGRKLLPTRLKLPKELLVGILFTLACVLPVATRIPNPTLLILPTVLYIALAWLNCHAIESWESGAAAAGQGSIRRLAAALAIASVAAAAATLHHPRITLLILTAALGASLLALLDRRRPQNPTTLRAAADLALLTPLLLFLL